MSVLIQVYILVTMLVWGIVLGIVFDIYRFLLPTSKVKGITQYIFDTIFWLVTTVVTFMVFVFANFGEVRLYLILGIAIGFVVYSIVFSGLIISILSFVRKIIYKVLIRLKGIILPLLYPFLWIAKKTILPIISSIKRFFVNLFSKNKRK